MELTSFVGSANLRIGKSERSVNVPPAEEMKVHATVAATLSLLVLCCGVPGVCQQEKPLSEQTTIWGGNRLVVIKLTKARRAAAGIVEYPGGDPVPSALVEVFDHPEALDHPWSDRPAQTRVTVCRTDESGRFAIQLADGDYEIRISKSTGIDVTSVVMKVRKSARIPVAPLVVPLTLGN